MHDPRDVLTSARLELARFPVVLDALLKDLDAAAWRARPALAEWAPVEIVCHLRDEEVEDFGARIRVILDGGASFAPIDPERWATERRYLDDDDRARWRSSARAGPRVSARWPRSPPRGSPLPSRTPAPASSPGSISSPPGSSTIVFI
jgi:hypothetical protein